MSTAPIEWAKIFLNSFSLHDKKSVMPAQAGNHLWFGTVARRDNSLTYNENHIISIAKRRLYGVYQRVILFICYPERHMDLFILALPVILCNEYTNIRKACPKDLQKDTILTVWFIMKFTLKFMRQ